MQSTVRAGLSRFDNAWTRYRPFDPGIGHEQIVTMTIDMAVVERICASNDIASLRVFGSVARGEDTESSDLDLIVEFSAPKSLLDLGGIEQEFEDSLGRKVDLLTPASLSPYLRDRVLSEAKVLYERQAA